MFILDDAHIFEGESPVVFLCRDPAVARLVERPVHGDAHGEPGVLETLLSLRERRNTYLLLENNFYQLSISQTVYDCNLRL